MNNKNLEVVLNSITEKFNKAQMFQSLQDDKSAMEILNTISNDEIKIMKAVGKQLIDVSNDILSFKKDYNKENGK